MPINVRTSEVNKSILDAVTSALTSSVFPIRGKNHTLEVTDVRPAGGPEHDVREALNAKLHGRSLSFPLVGTLVLKDASGRVIDKKEGARLCNIPIMTRHFSFIEGGTEFDVAKLRRLKSGVYHRIKDNGELEAHVNAAKGVGFRIGFDPPTRKFTLQYGSSHVQLYPVLRALGVPDTEIARVWGDRVRDANADAKATSEIMKLYKAMTGERTNDLKAAVEKIRTTLDGTVVRPDTTKMTLGRSYDRVTASMLLDSTSKLLAISRGEADPDPRDSVVFEEILDVSDFLNDRLTAMAGRIQWKVKNRLDKYKKVEDVWTADFVNQPIKTFFSQVSFAEVPTQVNPVDMFSGMTKTTIIGNVGGISSVFNVPVDSRMLDNSHLGFLDPVNTPEGAGVGTVLHLPIAAGKIGREPSTIVVNAKTGKREERTAIDLFDKNVAFPDQFDTRGPFPKPLKSKVSVVGDKNVLKEVPAKDVDYIVPSTKAMFSFGTNLVPFLQNDQPVRSSTANRHMSQALPLVHKEPPLVAAASGTTSPETQTFERIIGRFFTPTTKSGGKVVKIEKDEIVIKGPNGLEKIPLYDNYPLNYNGAFLHATPTVKVGDTVQPGQPVADTNFTVNGELALGTNLRIAFMPYYSSTFEDAILISDKAAEKLTSVHLYGHRVDLSDEVIASRDKFHAANPTKMDARQKGQLDADGVVKEGTVVQPGDVLIAALRKREPSKEELILRGFGKALSRPFSDASVTWDSQFPGIVERVVKTGSNIQVFVKSYEPAQVGDKLCYDEETEVLTSSGWVPFPKLTLDHEVAACTPVRGKVMVAFRHPERIVDLAYTGPLHRVESDDISLGVTPEHTMLVKRPSWPGGPWTGKNIASCYGSAFCVPVAAVQSDGASEWCDKNELSLLATIYRYGEREDGAIVLVSPNSPATLSIRRALDAVGARYTRVRVAGNNGSRFIVTDARYLNLDLSRLPEWLFRMPPDLIRYFVRTLFKVTGRYKILRLVGSGVLDDIQALAALGGCAPPLVVDRDSQSVSLYLSDARPFRPVFPEYHWVEQFSGRVYCCTVQGGFLIVRRNFKVCISGNSGRHGNKGVIGEILPESMMPRTADGPVDIVMNPISVAGRLIVGATLETALAKVARKEGVQLAVSSFEPDPAKRIIRVTKTITVKPHERTVQTREGPVRKHVSGYTYTREYDYSEDVRNELKAAGISDEEEVFDPKTGKSVGKVLVGEHYIMKLVHQSEKKAAARSGGPGYDYDGNMSPTGGGGTGGQRFGELGLYALLAHGALSLTREAQTFRSSADQNEIWSALQAGEPLPPPKPSFAYSKFLALLAAMGVKVDKNEDTFQLMPLTDKDVLAMSAGELTNPTAVLRAKDLKPEKGGLFDEDITGGVEGERWCLHPDTVIPTEYGYATIGFLVNNRYSGRVLSRDPETGALVLARVIGLFKHPVGPGDTGVLTCGKMELYCTKKHKLIMEDFTETEASEAKHAVVLAD